MSAKTLVVALVGATCIAAAAAGGFIALRMNRADRALSDTGAPNPPATVAPTSSPIAAPPATPDVASPAPPSVPPVAPPISPRAKTPTPKAARSTTKSLAVTPSPAATPPPPDDQTPPPPPVPPPASAAGPPPAQQAAVADSPPADPKPVFDEVVVNTDSVIGLALNTTVSSSTAKVEDKITAHVTRDVMVDGRVAIPANARLEGVVTTVQHGGKFKDQGHIGIRFTTLYLPDNTKFPIQTEPIFRDGEPPGNAATAKVGTGAVIGTIVGVILGGKKGAAVGAAAGAGGGAAATANGHESEAVFQSGVPMTVRLSAPVTVTVRRDQDP